MDKQIEKLMKWKTLTAGEIPQGEVPRIDAGDLDSWEAVEESPDKGLLKECKSGYLKGTDRGVKAHVWADWSDYYGNVVVEISAEKVEILAVRSLDYDRGSVFLRVRSTGRVIEVAEDGYGSDCFSRAIRPEVE